MDKWNYGSLNEQEANSWMPNRGTTYIKVLKYLYSKPPVQRKQIWSQRYKRDGHYYILDGVCTLKNLRVAKFISVRKVGNKAFYSITEKGKEYLDWIRNKKNDPIVFRQKSKLDTFLDYGVLNREFKHWFDGAEIKK